MNKTETYELLEAEFGEKVAYRMAEILGGVSIYIPKTDAIQRAKRDKNIISEFTGYNIRELAIKYNISENQVRLIIKAAKIN